ncbi:MAG: PaaI family thioesterase [Desulfarculus sp.]|nr:PaaI family thioesterase [Desulfarculus sp.]
MPTLNPAWVAAVSRLVDQSPYFQLQSMRIAGLGPGSSRLEIVLEHKHLQPFGMVHGGGFSGLVDAAGFWALYTQTGPGLGLTTVEMKLNYLAPAVTGRLIGLGRALKLGKTLGLAEARVEDPQGRLLAHGTVTLMALESLSLGGQAGLPPKFLES